MPQTRQRHLPDDGDRRRVDHLGHVRPDERDPEQHLPLLVDDDPGLPPVVVGVRAGSGDP
jgi:hypothetical protein